MRAREEVEGAGRKGQIVVIRVSSAEVTKGSKAKPGKTKPGKKRKLKVATKERKCRSWDGLIVPLDNI